MRRTTCLSILTAGLMFAVPASTVAQGPIIDWIIKMSGPGFLRVGYQQTWEGSGGGLAAAGAGGAAAAPGPSFNLALLGGPKVYSPDGTDAEVTDAFLISLQGTVDLPVVQGGAWSLGGSFGLSGHVFAGDFDAFVTGSIPVQLYYARRTGGRDIFRFGLGLHVFHFPEDAFTDGATQLDMGVTDGVELGLGLTGSLVFK